jgi:hypothetical protein
MSELVFTILSSDRLLDAFLFKYERLINEWYEKSQQPAYIERIQGGLIYIIRDFAEFQKMVENSPKTVASLQDTLLEDENTLKYIKSDFFGDVVFPANHKFDFIISNTVFSADRILPLWKTSLESIDGQIQFEIVDNYSFRLRFNTLDALIRYLVVIFNLNFTKNK